MSDPDSLDVAVRAMCDGCEDGFRIVYRAVHPRLLRYVTVLVGTDDAEDVTAETWGQAFRDLDRFRGGADGFAAWITTIGRHRALDHLRRRTRRPVVATDLTDLDRPDRADLEDAAVEALTTAAAVALIRTLPPDQAEAVMLRAVMGLDARTAAAVLGKRPGAVRTAAHRGLSSLACRLGSRPASLLGPGLAAGGAVDRTGDVTGEVADVARGMGRGVTGEVTGRGSGDVVAAGGADVVR